MIAMQILYWGCIIAAVISSAQKDPQGALMMFVFALVVRLGPPKKDQP